MENKIIVSIHAPRVEGDSTNVSAVAWSSGFNPRPPGGGRLRAHCRVRQIASFNPRPPGGGRRRENEISMTTKLFQSTPPGWRATRLHAQPNEIILSFNPRPPGGGRPACLPQPQSA